MNEPYWHPDLLRRFVATPYVFSNGNSPNRLWVESNDLEIALCVRHSGLAQGNRSKGLFCKLIRDTSIIVDGSEASIISDGNLRVLHHGRGTILIHDLEKSELLGFVSSNEKTHELVSSLIPTLLRVSSEDESIQSPFTKK
jgi:hypothetical protein